MKQTPFLAVLALSGAILFMVRPAAAQEDGPEDQAAEIAQLFGQGSGVRGIVTGAATGNFLVRTDEGENYKVFYSPNTRIMKERQPTDANEIHLGDELIAAGQLDRKAKTLGAVFLLDVDAAEVRKARAGLGKTWTAGKVMAIRNLTITIEVLGSRQTQIVAVDENTSFQKRNESVTLGDIKVGDFVSARGAAHDKTFLATVLRVVEAGSMAPLAAGEEPDGSKARSAGSTHSGASTNPQSRLITSSRPQF